MEWNLRDRLQQAEKQRRLAAGLPAGEAPPEPEPERPRAKPVIDLTDPSHVLTYAPPTRPTPPLPSTYAAASRSTRSTQTSGALPTMLPSRRASMGLPVWQGTTVTAPRASTTPSSAGDAEQAPFDVDTLSRTIDGEPVASEPVIASKAPTKDRCPSCHGKVRLDRFDLDNAVANMSCTECGFTYTAKSPKL